MNNNENRFVNINGSDLIEYYNYLLSISGNIALELFYIKKELDQRVIQNLNKEEIDEEILPEEYFKVRKREINE